MIFLEDRFPLPMFAYDLICSDIKIVNQAKIALIVAFILAMILLVFNMVIIVNYSEKYLTKRTKLYTSCGIGYLDECNNLSLCGNWNKKATLPLPSHSIPLFFCFANIFWILLEFGHWYWKIEIHQSV